MIYPLRRPERQTFVCPAANLWSETTAATTLPSNNSRHGGTDIKSNNQDECKTLSRIRERATQITIFSPSLRSLHKYISFNKIIFFLLPLLLAFSAAKSVNKRLRIYLFIFLVTFPFRFERMCFAEILGKCLMTFLFFLIREIWRNISSEWEKQ